MVNRPPSPLAWQKLFDNQCSRVLVPSPPRSRGGTDSPDKASNVQVRDIGSAPSGLPQPARKQVRNLRENQYLQREPFSTAETPWPH